VLAVWRAFLERSEKTAFIIDTQTSISSTAPNPPSCHECGPITVYEEEPREEVEWCCSKSESVVNMNHGEDRVDPEFLLERIPRLPPYREDLPHVLRIRREIRQSPAHAGFSPLSPSTCQYLFSMDSPLYNGANMPTNNFFDLPTEAMARQPSQQSDDPYPNQVVASIPPGLIDPCLETLQAPFSSTINNLAAQSMPTSTDSLVASLTPRTDRFTPGDSPGFVPQR
jgi:hypothetical protein